MILRAKTSLYSEVPKKQFFDCDSMCFGFSAAKLGGVLMKTFPKGSFTRFFEKMAPRGGSFYQISPDVALTSCIQLYSKHSPKTISWTPSECFLISAPQK